MIIGFTGRIGHGKTTAANHVVVKYGAERFSFAAPLKAMLKDIYGLSEEQLYGTQEQKATVDPRHGKSPRELMQFLGTEVCRKHLGEDVWANAAISKLEEGKLYVCDDVRFPNEARKIEEFGGVIIKIECLDDIPESDHSSEQYKIVYEIGIKWRAENGAGAIEKRVDVALKGLIADQRGWAREFHKDVTAHYVQGWHSIDDSALFDAIWSRT